MKTKEKDRLHVLFNEMQGIEPSEKFATKLMLRIENELVAKKQQKQVCAILGIAAGIAGVIGIPALIFHFLGINLTIQNMQVTFPEMSPIFDSIATNPQIITLALSILCLLIGDSLIRKYIQYKKSHL